MQKWILAAVAAMTVQAHAGSNADAITHVANNVILKTYTDLAAATQNLQAAVETLSETPNQANLERAQQAWREARAPWESSEAFLFGPVSALAIDPALDTWPLNTRDVDSILASKSVLTADFVRNLGVNLQGFHTIEYLLFGSGETGEKKKIEEMTARQLEYLRAASAVLAEHAALLARSWETNADPDRPELPGYAEFVAHPGKDNPYYDSERAVLLELAGGMVAILDELANGKLGEPLGADIGSADPSLVESPFSGNAVMDFTNNLRSIQNVFTGTYGGAAGPGLKDVVAASDDELAQLVELRIGRAISLVQAIAGDSDMDFRVAIADVDGRERILAAIDEVNSLRLLIEEKVIPLLEQ